ncbi:protein SYM1 [Metschnikowia bicuspidata var. bicuspidata NRRL YB-4993]|uniref:Protein SYM1 n=1 Tax=Metschnikowia bicuspidata var. bicuspidata NRRL YB-4993 TaxID=869754 RepID=A0A1A0HIK5_9ASCO|nr:protein SYM1 [Metschnikowia bicuspidata var. bicuspidata NRRL YB-4993]OBA23845.1 protein SYM1 [Metschnikowia bicuspidata var. bicuspidata NRRL YB-4993]
MSFFFRKYNHLMNTRPLATNIATTGFLFGAGDFLAQQLEMRRPAPAGLAAKSAAYDMPRTARAVAYGSLVFGPLAGKWFGYLARVSVGSSAAANTLARVALDQCVFAPLVGIPLYFSCMTVMEAPADVRGAVTSKLHHAWWDTVRTNWMVWPAVQVANFGLVPPLFRLLVVNFLSIGWNCYLLMENSEK